MSGCTGNLRARIARCEARQEQRFAFLAVKFCKELRRQDIGRTIEHNFACSQSDCAGAICDCVFDLVKGEDHRDTVFLVHVGQNIHHATRRARIKRSDWLVGDDDLLLLHHRTRNRDALLLPTR